MKKPRICGYKGCKVVMSFANKGRYCFVCESKYEKEKIRQEYLKKLRKSKRWLQITNWFLSKKELNFALEPFKKTPFLVKIRKRIRRRKGEKITEFAVFKKFVKEE